MMRKIRDELDQQIQEMTWEEENDFLQKNLISFKFLIDKKNHLITCCTRLRSTTLCIAIDVLLATKHK